MERNPIKIIFALPVILTLFACATSMTPEQAKNVLLQNTMTLEQARRASLETTGSIFVPPPRSICDTLALLTDTSPAELSAIKKAKNAVNQSPAADLDEVSRIFFLDKRSAEAAKLGLFQEAMHDGREVLRLIENTAPSENLQVIIPHVKPVLYFRLGLGEKNLGNYRQAVELFEKARLTNQGGSNICKELVELYLALGDTATARQRLAEGENLRSYIGMPASLIKANYASMHASYLEAEGKFAAAEFLRRRAIADYKDYFSSFFTDDFIRFYLLLERYMLGGNLMRQGRIIEAEAEARLLIKESAEFYGKASPYTGIAVSLLGHVLLLQGKINDAERLVRAGINAMHDYGLPQNSSFLVLAKGILANILAYRGDFAEALSWYQMARDFIADNYFARREIIRNPYVIGILLATGNTAAAADYIMNAYEHNKKLLGDGHYLTAEIKGLSGVLNFKVKKYDAALTDFKSALPVLAVARDQTGADHMRRRVFQTILESYLELLNVLPGDKRKEGLDVAAESFLVADLLMNNSVGTAMLQSAVRSAVRDRELAGLIRSEQDMLRQLRLLDENLVNMAALPDVQQLNKELKALQSKSETLTAARAVILGEIGRRFPQYAEFLTPPVAAIASIRLHLRPGETFVIIYSAKAGTYIWALPQQGDAAYHISRLDGNEIGKIVAALRGALAPDKSAALGNLPPFDTALAYELYKQILQPVAAAWKDSPHLLIAASGPLAQLPFSLLPVEKSNTEKENILFSSYRRVPWLIRRHTVTMLPTVASFLSLRALPAGDPSRKAFIGFGDPLFNPAQMEAGKEEKAAGKKLNGSGLTLRGVRITAQGGIDDHKTASLQLENLNRLPDTSDEILEIAAILKADLRKDVFLGKDASREQVTSRPLTERQVIAFATHALVPGDLDGLDQPALALSSPLITGNPADGLLTMSDIMRLKLDADWVVLSACSTGAAEGVGSEALSGLGRAFFYAGTRSVLASMWPVETTSAKKLVSGVFRHQQTGREISRSRALQKAMLNLIDDAHLIDPVTGKVAASYAHPLFWAPFVLVGDPGGNVNAD